MGEINHADDAEPHRVADGDQTVDGAERDPVDELLEENCHPLPLRLKLRPPDTQTSDSQGLTKVRRSGNVACHRPAQIASENTAFVSQCRTDSPLRQRSADFRGTRAVGMAQAAPPACPSDGEDTGSVTWASWQSTSSSCGWPRRLQR